ncbi:MAG: ATP-dependent chaperone ClpB, partial [Phormidesmis sp. CAN_BIN36]|nr:ATP-dependent chaperone ClpB [Phormidesmis sp. CAN_BIN36]
MQPTDPSKFTDKAWEAIVQAQDVVRRYKHQNLEVEHLITSVIEQKDGLANKIFTKAGVDVQQLGQQVDDYAKRQPKVGNTEQLYLGRYLDTLLDRSELARNNWQDDFISIEHFLIGLANDPRLGIKLFRGFNLDTAKLETAIKEVRG